MPGIISTAPGKTILFGEHSVVYGKPAIAVPVNEKRAKVKIIPDIVAPKDSIQFVASQIDLNQAYHQLEKHHPLKVALDEVKKFLNILSYPSCKIYLETTIPISSGLGSSAAISVALIKGLLDFVGFQSTPDIVAKLAFQVEIEFHGNPSGIDNTVIAFNKPILFQKDRPIEFITPGGAFSILIADTGIKGNTKTAVAKVHERWTENPAQYNNYFEEMGNIALNAKASLEAGNFQNLGTLMNANQDYLRKIGVSHPTIEELIEVAIQNGCYGAKLCGGGLGGNIVVLINENSANQMADLLLSAGATEIIHLKLGRGGY
jgi:mevalonate kinase